MYSKTPGLRRFLDSTKEFDSINVEFEHYPGHIKRWDYLPKDLEGQIIFSDTDDVIYQGGMPGLSGIVTAPENVLHKDSFWKQFCVGEFEVLLDKSVYNIGGFSMPAEDLYELAEFIKARPLHWDQLSFNLWLLSKKHSPRIEVFLPLYNNFDKAVQEKGVWYYDGDIPCFVHANGNNKDKL